MMEVLGGEASAYAKHLKESMSAMHAEKMDDWIRITDTLSEMNQRIKNGDVPEAESLKELGSLINHHAYPASDQEKQTIVEFLENGELDEDFWKDHGPKFLRELHPLGRHMSLLRRADLGEEYCMTRYRTRTTDNLVLKWPPNLKNGLKTETSGHQVSSHTTRIHGHGTTNSRKSLMRDTPFPLTKKSRRTQGFPI